MVGANVLLGEFMRIVLVAAYVKLANRPQQCATLTASSSDDVLTNAISDWKETPDFEPNINSRFGADFHRWLVDEPAYSLERGVLAREGGHFIALFADREVAYAFCAEAGRLAAKYVPGIRCDTTILEGTERHDGPLTWEELADPSTAEVNEAHTFDLPVFRRCPEMPSLPADDKAKIWVGNSLRTQAVSFPVAQRYRYGSRYMRDEKIPGQEQVEYIGAPQYTLDVASLLRPKTPMWSSGGAAFPRDFESLAGGGYMAVVHIDGNSIGARTKPLRERSDQAKDFLEWMTAQFEIEMFFHRIRVDLRNALVNALTAVFTDDTANCDGKTKIRPYQILMVGGDDILLVCRADLALPFVARFAKSLESGKVHTKANCDEPLTVGVGVVISKPSLPFHRLHELAENLAGTAKALFRSRVRSNCAPISVVDWMVIGGTWAGDVAASRAKNDVVDDDCGNRLCLSGKPYVILNSADSATVADRQHCSLELLLEKKGALVSKYGRSDAAARGQLRGLESELRRGLTLGELSWSTLSPGASAALTEIGYQRATPWARAGTVNGRQICTTTVLDLIELAEIDELARQTRWFTTPAVGQEAAQCH